MIYALDVGAVHVPLCLHWTFGIHSFMFRHTFMVLGISHANLRQISQHEGPLVRYKLISSRSTRIFQTAYLAITTSYITHSVLM